MERFLITDNWVSLDSVKRADQSVSVEDFLSVANARFALGSLRAAVRQSKAFANHTQYFWRINSGFVTAVDENLTFAF